MRRIAIGVLVLGACNSPKSVVPETPAQPVTHAITAGGLDSLPIVPITDGRLVCLAVNEGPCPGTTATANWLRNGRYATWELHKAVEIWTPGKTDPELLGEAGTSAGQYDAPLSVAATRTGYTVLDMTSMQALLYDTKGRYTASLPFPPVSVSQFRGFAGEIAFLQLIRESGPDSAAVFEIREVDGTGDTVGHTVLHTPLPWLRLRAGRPVGPVPLFPTLPSYAIAADSDIVWSSSDVINVERRSASGGLRWHLTSDVPGPAIAPAEIAMLRARLSGEDQARVKGFDSSAAHTGKFYPAVAGLFLAPDGRVLLASAQLPSRDSVTYTLLSSDGAPVARFALPKRTRPLLFGGDSLLVQRAGANANQELRWLGVKPH